MSFDIGMSKNSIVISCLMLFLVACGGDGGDSVSAIDVPVSVENSSSSEKLSSSSVILSASKESSSSLAKSSSSSKVTDKVGEPAEPAEVTSSSSEKAKSSSSDTQSDAKQSSSSEKSGKSSSSVDDALSSSGKSESSSSSVEILSSSSSEERESSSSSAEEQSSSSEKSRVSSSSLSESSSNSIIGCKSESEDNCEYGELVDDRDGHVYKTVKIGNQVWMAENLNYADSAKTPSLLKRSWCYDNEPKKCDEAGRLYTWAAAIDSVKLANDADGPQECGFEKTCMKLANVQGICPPDWHLPTRVEWYILFTAVGGQSTAGKVLKSQSGWHDNGNGTDAFGFSALPSGYRSNGGSFNSDGEYAYFWSATESNRISTYYMYLDYYHELADLLNLNKLLGYSVRCVKD